MSYLESKCQAEQDNFEAYKKDLASNPKNMFSNPVLTYHKTVVDYNQRDFESMERLVNILEGQSKIRGTQHVFHKLHVLRNLR